MALTLGAISLTALFVGVQTGQVTAPFAGNQKTITNTHAARQYPIHEGIVASTFYIGEPATPDNGYIANVASTWDEKWTQHYGGVDSPDRRNGWQPVAFRPKENPFYIALPYNDLDDNGNRKASAAQAYWHSESGSGSWVKNRWVEVCKDSKCAYGQWEDAGPFGEDDASYVFGAAKPRNTTGLSAGIDVSPALDQYLSLNGSGVVSWRFIDNPPAGPWQDIITE